MVRMKLLIDTKSNRVAFAEAGKDCIDFLFQILSLPIATIIGLIKAGEGMKGSLPKLYKSLENLNHKYILPKKDKNALLNPVPTCPVPLLATQYASAFTMNTSHVKPILSFSSGRYCSDCGQQDGLVKGAVVYMVTDDLKVKPMSTISTVTLLNQFKVKDVTDLEEKVVYLGRNEAIKLLKTSLRSKKVLTDVFC